MYCRASVCVVLSEEKKAPGRKSFLQSCIVKIPSFCYLSNFAFIFQIQAFLALEKLSKKPLDAIHFCPFTADELSNYSVTTLAIVIVAPVIVLIVLSAVAILVFRRIHHNQMERLTSRDAEYGTIDGLIASNVGESTLAVSTVRGCLPSSLERTVKSCLRHILIDCCVEY